MESPELSPKEIKDAVFVYLDKRKTQFNSTRVTIDELLLNTDIQKPVQANLFYREWLVKLAKEKFDNESSTKKAQKATETKCQEESSPKKPIRTASSEEESKKTTTTDSNGVGGTTESNDE